MVQQGIPQPSDTDVMRRLSSSELALHCKRVTRGVKETTSLLSSLLESLDRSKGCDTLGVPLFHSEKMKQIWSIQSKHVACIQDPPGVRLYTQVSTLKKGGVMLPVYRCARGSTSLESFHLHLNRFISGTLAKDINFQVFLLDGVFRWNCDREIAAVDSNTQDKLTPKTYSGPLKNAVNKLAEDVMGKAVFENYKPPGKYTGELIGIEYLYSQTGEGSTDYEFAARELAGDKVEDSVDLAGDEGFVEQEFTDLTIPPVPDLQGMEEAEAQEAVPKPAPKLHIPTDEEYRQILIESGPGSPASPEQSFGETIEEKHQMEESSTDDTVGPDNVPGYRSVLELADFLVTLREQSVMSPAEVQRLRVLWQALSAYNKNRTVFPPRYSKTHLQGRFKSSKKMVAPGVESIERAILGPNQGPAQWPNCNRYTEATVEKLLEVYLSDRRIEGKLVTRWSLVLGAYHRIRRTILNNHTATWHDSSIQLSACH